MSSRVLKNYLPWLALSLFLAYQYMIRVLPNTIASELTGRFAMSASMFGQFLGFYYIGYTAMHIPFGILFDRFNFKLVTVFSILTLSFSVLLVSFTASWKVAILLRTIAGISSSGAVVGLFKVIRLSFHKEKFPLMLGLSVTIAFILGAFYGSGHFAPFVLENFGFDSLIFVIFSVGLAITVLALFIPSNTKGAEESTFFSDVKALRSHRTWIYVSLLGGLMVGPMEGFADGWAPLFFLKNSALIERLPQSCHL